jgi:predicted dinucleotide-binding enzyme
VKTIGIIGAGDVGSHIARAAVVSGYSVVLANSRGPETLTDLIAQLGPAARADTAVEAAKAGDFVVIAVPLKLVNNMPTDVLAGKIVIDTNKLHALARRRSSDDRRGRHKRARASSSAASHLQGSESVHTYSGAPHPDLGETCWFTGPIGAIRIK